MANPPMSVSEAEAIAERNGGSHDAGLQAADRINAHALADHNDAMRAELQVVRMQARQAAPADQLLPVVLSSGGRGRSGDRSV